MRNLWLAAAASLSGLFCFGCPSNAANITGTTAAASAASGAASGVSSGASSGASGSGQGAAAAGNVGTAAAGASSGGGSGALASCKRGLAYDLASPVDQRARIPGIGWWYNWSPTPNAGVQGTYAALGLEFVPMQWGGSVNVATLESQIPAGAKYLLGFNEPNFVQQSNLTPQQAAALWPQLEQVATDKGLKLVSPAVNFCGPAADCINQDTSPFDWLDQFFAACTGCQVDYLGVHIYLQNGAGLQGVLAQYEAKYTQPIWLTEWADLGSGVSDADELTLMQQALPILEADPRVFRYSWFTGRASSQPSLDVLGPDAGLLTTIGQTYVTGAGACTP